MARGALLCCYALALTLIAPLDEGAVVRTPTTKLPKCNSGMYECQNGRCIPEKWLCDKDTDCEDGDDENEVNCSSKSTEQCNLNEYQCETRTDSSRRPNSQTLFYSLPTTSLFNNFCIPKRWVCDGEADCFYGDDENNCQNVKITCTDQQFLCQSFESHGSTCVPKSWHCDGTVDCAGGLDERDCNQTLTNQDCNSAVDFKCASGKCIYDGWRCDGDDDCGDGRPGEPSSDEKDCSDKKPCDESTHFKCKKVQFCILKTWVCDGEADCPDQTDEDSCTSFHNVHSVTCKADEFKCTSGSHCINRDFVCDGEGDCPDKSDEFNCKRLRECKEGFKACSNGICRPETDFCNGRDDCMDAKPGELSTDEKDCKVFPTNYTHFCNPDTEFTCPKEVPLHCIPYDKLCSTKDSTNDCTLSSVCNNNQILGTCNNTDPNCKCRSMYSNSGTVCVCPDGFETRHGLCVDINECNTPGSCDQSCENLPGSYRCHCHRGYRLVSENGAVKATKCRAIGSDPLLLLSNRAAIRQYDMQTNKYQPLVNRLESAVAMDYWHKNETLIWSDVSKEKIMMCRMKQDGLLKNQTNCVDDGTNTTLVSKDILTPDGLAVDWVHGLLFWTDTGLDKIFVLDLVTRHRRVIIDQGLDEPRAIAVDPSAGLIFWSDWGFRARIERAGMNGEDRVEVLSGNAIRWPNGLAVDILDKRIYWADAKIKTISSSNYYGQDVRTVLHSSDYLKHPFSLAVFQERLYWSDWDKEGVLTVNKFRGDDVKVLISGVSGPMTVRVYHEMAQPNHTNKCDQNLCSHLCLPRAYIRAKDARLERTESTFKPYSCACATGYIVDANDMTACLLKEALVELASSGNSSRVAMVIFLIFVSVCGAVLATHIWNSRRSRQFSSLQFENPIYRRTTQDPDNFEFATSAGDNSLGAFPSDVINPPPVPSRLVLNQSPTLPSSLTPNSNDFYHPSNYSYDQPVVREESGETGCRVWCDALCQSGDEVLAKPKQKGATGRIVQEDVGDI